MLNQGVWRRQVASFALLSALCFVTDCSDDGDRGTDGGPAPDAAVEADAGGDADASSPDGSVGGAILGLVTAGGGVALGGVEISTSPATGYAITSQDGLYALHGVPPGSYAVTASRSGYVELAKNADVLPDGTVYVDFVLDTVAPEPGRVEGRVSDFATGAPIPGAAVVTDPVTTSATTAIDGSYAIEAVVPGTYEVSASVEGHQSATSGAATVESGRTTTIDLQLVALVTYTSRCAECHSTEERLLADLQADPPPEPLPAESTGEG